MLENENQNSTFWIPNQYDTQQSNYARHEHSAEDSAGHFFLLIFFRRKITIRKQATKFI